MKTLRSTAMFMLGLGVLSVSGVMAAAADSPAANVSPTAATYFDNHPHTIAGNSSLWFSFYYSLTESGAPRPTTMTMPYGNASHVGFAIWTTDNVHDLKGKGPFGQGQPQALPCDGSWCQGDDLVWDGSIGGTGWYYVQVTNNNPYPTTEDLQIAGAGVFVTPPSAPSVPVPSTPSMDDPRQAVTIDGSPATIPGNSARWFNFFYLTDYNKPPFVTIRLLYGVMTGLRYEVYAPERLGAWWDIAPNGHGTTEILACPSGKCATTDLTWGGAFGATGTYYVRVINPNASDVTTTLSLQWR